MSDVPIRRWGVTNNLPPYTNSWATVDYFFDNLVLAITADLMAVHRALDGILSQGVTQVWQ